MVEDELKHRDVVCSSTTGKLSMDIGECSHSPQMGECSRFGYTPVAQPLSKPDRED